MITWPTTQTASKLVQTWQADPAEFIGAGYMPLNTTDYLNTSIIKYDRTKPVTGMTNAYGRNSKVNLVKATGVEVFKQDTAYWKDQLRLDEFDFLENRALGPDEFQRLGNQRFLMMALQGDVRLETRMEQLRWAAMRNEFASGVTYNGVKILVDYGITSAGTASPLWTSPATAKPLTDILNVVLSLRSTGATWVDIVMNDVTASYLLDNTQITDKVNRSQALADLNISDVGNIIKNLTMGNGQIKGCPTIRNVVVYATQYIDDAGANQYFVPTNKVQFIAGRDNPLTGATAMAQMQLGGEFASTPAIVDGFQGTRPGKFMIVEDYSRTGNPHLLMTPGIFGMPVVYHPEWFKTLTVG